MPFFVQMCLHVIQSPPKNWQADGELIEAHMNLSIQSIEEIFVGLRFGDRQSCHAQG